jgi:hypothetical protein
MVSLRLVSIIIHLVVINMSKFKLADTTGQVNIHTSKLNHQGGSMLGRAPSTVLYVLVSLGLLV